MRSSFIFGHKGKPSLSRTVCSRFPMHQREPGKSWFKHIIELPYGGWGFYARLHCETFLDLSPVFNYSAENIVRSDADTLAAEFYVLTQSPAIVLDRPLAPRIPAVVENLPARALQGCESIAA